MIYLSRYFLTVVYILFETGRFGIGDRKSLVNLPGLLLMFFKADLQIYM